MTPHKPNWGGRRQVSDFRTVIVPESLRMAIESALDAAIAACPCADADRTELYSQLLAYFDEHGVIPEFLIAPQAKSDAT
jgi:uncharacterized protein YutE (UPF0331/DUF86 family)